MIKAIQNKFLAIIIISTLISSFLFTYLFAEYMEIRTKDDLAYSLMLIDNSIDYTKSVQPQINTALSKSQMRISVIDFNGKVIADTAYDVKKMENHSDREEIKQAKISKSSVAVRYSETLKENLLYVAMRSERADYILRISIPYNGIEVFMLALLPIIIMAAFISFVISLFFANRFAKTISNPLDEISQELLQIQINEEQPVYFNRYDYEELNNVCHTAEILSQRVMKNQQRLKEEKNKISYILDNMTEGIILIDEKKTVATINKSALNILSCPLKQENKNIVFYTQQLKIIDGVNRAVDEGIPSYFDIENQGKIYNVHITKIKEGILQHTGAIVLLIDVTTERENQKIRQEFFSNASHELKTPLTSIIGYSELLDTDMAKTRYKEFVGRIKTEAENMAGLINDILMISRLEAGIIQEEKSKIQLKPMLEEIIKVYEPDILRDNIDLKFKGENIVVDGVYSGYYQLFNNLISNAVKYNMPDGRIFIDCEKRQNKLVFSVKNTGASIPPEYEKRVFERFFRVDKGRCKKIKGTGLGLAIVKHITDALNGSITLENQEDMTVFRVEIPLEEVYTVDKG